MKNYNFSLLLLLLKISLSAQVYTPFDTTVVWNTLKTGAASSGSCVRDDDYCYFVNGYILNNNLMWHKVYVNVAQRRYTCPTGVSEPLPSSMVTTSFVGLYNNDISTKKVYFVPTSSLTSSFTPNSSNLLFDFDKTLGDTMWVYNSGNPTMPIWTLGFKIYIIDSILFDGKYHKRFIGQNVGYPNYAPYLAYFIEGIGCTAGVFDADFYFFDRRAIYLVCFSGVSNSKTFSGIYNFANGSPTGITDVTNCDWIATGLSELNLQENSDIQLYPSPFRSNLSIKLNQFNLSQLTLEIRDISGRTIKKISLDITKLDQVVELEDLRSGVYIATFCANQKEVYRTKVIKQD